MLNDALLQEGMHDIRMHDVGRELIDHTCAGNLHALKRLPSKDKASSKHVMITQSLRERKKQGAHEVVPGNEEQVAQQEMGLRAKR